MSTFFNVMVAVAEANPLIKEGRLGDVAGSLPQALRQIGHKLMRRVMQADFSWKSSISKYVSLYQIAQHEVVIDGTNI